MFNSLRIRHHPEGCYIFFRDIVDERERFYPADRLSEEILMIFWRLSRHHKHTMSRPMGPAKSKRRAKGKTAKLLKDAHYVKPKIKAARRLK
jgi:hypothetical protein